jgi:hypothetical protein
MPAPKSEAVHQKTVPAAAQKSERKPWKKKTAIEVFFDQEGKLRKEIAEMEEDLGKKRSQLQKFEQARKLFEGM